MTLRRCLKIFLALVWVVCLYRSITQAIVHDEALTYQLYLAAPFRTMFQYFDANHHFLNTLLMKVSVSLFGVSEWSMRLPALVGAGVYFAAVYRICTRQIQAASVSLLAAVLLALNPFLLDFMVAARGYGMAMGLWMWALAILMQYLGKPDPGATRNLLQAGAALGLSVMANLVFAVPAAVLVMVSWVWLKTWSPPGDAEPSPAQTSKKRRKRRKRPSLSSRDRTLQAFWRWVALPALAGCIVLFLVFPITGASAANFYAGADSLAASLRSLYDVSLAHGGPLRQAALSSGLRDGVAFGLAPAILLFGLAIGIRRREVLLLLPTGVAVACGVLLVFLHFAVHLLYPLDRTGIYFLPLLALALAGLAERPGVISIGAWTISALLVGQFLLSFETRKFALWEYDADTPAILHELARVVPGKRPGSVRIANSWQLEPALNFYAAQFRLTWLQPITRDAIAAGADYYILAKMDRQAIDDLHLQAIYTGPNSGTILAVPPK